MRTTLFSVGDVPAVLWTSDDDAAGPRPLILFGHGGGRHKQDPELVALAARLVGEGGYAVACADAPNHGDRPADAELDRVVAGFPARIAAGADRAALIAEAQALMAGRTVPEWRAVLDHLRQQADVGPGPVGYWGISLGCGLGVPFVAAEPRVRAAVLGHGGAPNLAAAAAAITVPVAFLVQWDDERVPREQSLALFDAFGAAQKTLHANPGRHGEVPGHEHDAALRFFQRHL
ncbi:dienelactone hydrolase family protein [Actinoplanes palleronii]|uniref:Dienelactone hydrolase domain-containing protein n=1 Tax=Actinoplanes palleronii TaxID=113570 RepID=A0ABQ4B9M3_9ACTN|nr:dienelactone hydrolase family protein [Actinoplanes palleronii]GIE67290.1 hypothetical protein Apa02nite_033980 [Actinoplanes palleronii]